MQGITCNVGMDVHKKFIFCVALDDSGEVIFEKKINNEPHELDLLIRRIAKDSKVALESCSCWEYVYDYLDNSGFTNIYLANPSRVGLIAKSKKKTDRYDAHVLADLVRTNLLPTSYAPSRIIREERRITRYRASLAVLQTEVKNRIHAILIRQGIINPFENIFTEKGFEYLRTLDLSWADRVQMDDYIGVLRHLKHKAQKAEELIKEYIEHHPQAKLLVTIPGIGTYSALSIIAEIGDIRRFASAKRLTSFAGLNPSVSQSGERCHMGRISKLGDKHLRRMLGQCANIAIMHDSTLSKLYHRIRKKRNHNVAITAVARKMLTFIFTMLKYNITYQQLHIHKKAS